MRLESVTTAEQRRRIEYLPLTFEASRGSFERLMRVGGGSLPPHVRVEYGPGLSPTQQAGAAGIAWDLIAGGRPTLPPNHMTTVPLSSGNLLITHLFAAGRQMIVIETPGLRGGRAVPARNAWPRARDSGHGPRGEQLTGPWGVRDRAALRAALAQVPSSALVPNLTFRRGGRSPSGHGGLYERHLHRITIYNEAFGGGAYGAAPQVAEVIVHEIGHASSQEPMVGPGTQGLSGERIGPTGAVSPDTADLTPAFRQAARRDGVAPGVGRTAAGGTATLVGGVTDYANESWEELFAEAFSLYFNSPGVLHALRPNIFDYFEGSYHHWTGSQATNPGVVPAAPPGGLAPGSTRRR
jgi:hypothetical protein